MRIKNLTGIEHFPSLKSLNCENNRLTRLDVSMNSRLKWLWCRENKLTSLNLGKQKNLQELDASKNRLAKLDLGDCPKLKKIVNSHIIVERYEDGVLGWRPGYPHPMYTDATTVLLDGNKAIYRKVFWVEYTSSAVSGNVIEDDYITIYGTCDGTHTYETIMGASITIPAIDAEKIIIGRK